VSADNILTEKNCLRDSQLYVSQSQISLPSEKSDCHDLWMDYLVSNLKLKEIV